MPCLAHFRHCVTAARRARACERGKAARDRRSDCACRAGTVGTVALCRPLRLQAARALQCTDRSQFRLPTHQQTNKQTNKQTSKQTPPSPSPSRNRLLCPAGGGVGWGGDGWGGVGRVDGWGSHACRGRPLSSARLLLCSLRHGCVCLLVYLFVCEPGQVRVAQLAAAKTRKDQDRQRKYLSMPCPSQPPPAASDPSRRLRVPFPRAHGAAVVRAWLCVSHAPRSPTLAPARRVPTPHAVRQRTRAPAARLRCAADRALQRCLRSQRRPQRASYSSGSLVLQRDCSGHRSAHGRSGAGSLSL